MKIIMGFTFSVDEQQRCCGLGVSNGQVGLKLSGSKWVELINKINWAKMG